MKTADFYQAVTDSMVALIEAGTRPWENPVTRVPLTRPMRHNGKGYQGINILILWGTATDRGYTSPFWMTFKQAVELGACVRKGEKGTHIYFAKQFEREGVDETTGEETTERVSVGRCYSVFNADQVENLPAHFYAKPAPRDPFEAGSAAEAFIAATGASIVHGGNRAYYIAQTDRIHLPHRDAFKAPADYYSTALHELTHWTSHQARADRPLNAKRFGDESYAFEELVAELGAAFLCADLGLIGSTREDHASYLAGWLKVLKADKRAIFTAASLAEKAAGYLSGLQPQTRPLAA